MSKKKKKTKQPIGIYVAIILIVVSIALLEAILRRPKTEKYTYTSSQSIEKVTPSNRTFDEDASSDEYIVLKKGLEIPICGAKHKENDHEIRNFQNYSLCYRESYEQAEWSAYCITSKQLVKNSERTNDFRPDNSISTQSASLADYKGSGYDRGHLTPAADMSFSELAMSETFYMSNMSPQEPQFNRGIWMYLEAQVRKWAEKFGRVYVVSGPILDKLAVNYKTIGANQVVVPEYYYKVILVPIYEDETDFYTPEDSNSVMAIGFIIPNRKCDEQYWSYAVSIDEVERRTGLDFFSLLEDDIEVSIESNYILSNWK